MVLIYSTILLKKASNEFSKQAMVLNYQTIFKANNGFELLNHVSSKQASKQKEYLQKQA